jgi:dienelactone hydrolase
MLALCLVAAERPVPAPGVPVAPADRAEIEAGLGKLSASIASLKAKLGPKSLLVADVAIFHDAVRYALAYNEFLKPEEVQRGKDLLRRGQDRAEALAAGQSPWASQTGLVVRGYVSKIDDSVQPYGLVVPPTFRPDSPHRWRVDAWFHGRSETLTEVNFLHDRMTNRGQFTPDDTIVLHLYGRFCNANKFAGEVDLFEALAAVRRLYKVDNNRISVRGFSMGGAAAWHIAAHHAGLWAAAAPGAGFSETAEFLKVFQKETVQPAWWETKLWRMYDATEYAINFFNLPLVAYSGEKDRQIQAAQVMERELAKVGIGMTHVIGPNTEHRYHPDSKVAIDRKMDAIVARGRDPYPTHVKFTTFTLAYNRMKWVVVDALGQHWERATVDAEIKGESAVSVKTANVDGLTLRFGAGGCPLANNAKVVVTIDGAPVPVAPPMSDRSWNASFRRIDGRWRAAAARDATLAKRHGLQGPIDDAFMDRFIIVKPTGQAVAPGASAWVRAEMDRAITEWRRHFRGEPIVRHDSQITDADIASSHLALWGDPGSNSVLGRIAAKLPIRWSGEGVVVGTDKYDAARHAPVLVYPNPLNPAKYVVLNSGFTFREYDYLNNARQISKLPDWAVIDLSTPPDSRFPGRVASAGFFGERWELKSGR